MGEKARLDNRSLAAGSRHVRRPAARCPFRATNKSKYVVISPGVVQRGGKRLPRPPRRRHRTQPRPVHSPSSPAEPHPPTPPGRHRQPGDAGDTRAGNRKSAMTADYPTAAEPATPTYLLSVIRGHYQQLAQNGYASRTSTLAFQNAAKQVFRTRWPTRLILMKKVPQSGSIHYLERKSPLLHSQALCPSASELPHIGRCVQWLFGTRDSTHHSTVAGNRLTARTGRGIPYHPLAYGRTRGKTRTLSRQVRN